MLLIAVIVMGIIFSLAIFIGTCLFFKCRRNVPEQEFPGYSVAVSNHLFKVNLWLGPSIRDTLDSLAFKAFGIEVAQFLAKASANAHLKPWA